MKRTSAVLLLLLAGCGTLGDLIHGPQVYGGVRRDLAPNCVGLTVLDVPLSAVLDTALLPLTALTELVRAITGWPPFESYSVPEEQPSR